MDHARSLRVADPQIAIVGMGCRLPSDIDSPSALWRLLEAGRDAISGPPVGRTPAAPVQVATRMPRWGGFLRDVAGFDADFFGVSGKEADVLDPQHRLLLEVTWEALEHAGLPPEKLAGTATGLFSGLSYTDYMESLAGQPAELEGAILTNGHCVAAGRISYLLGLQGPCVALDTACSSSLVALHLACQALRNEECDLALAGGVTLMLGTRTTMSFARMGMLSPTGRCRTFDAAADGFVRGEGCGVVVLKRLADALRDDDRILALVRGSAVNQDGRSDVLASPSVEAQKALYHQALDRAGTDPRELGLVETHGTGTPVGDPVEFSSVAAVYGLGQGRCALGSVKTNVGHLEPAAGVIGLIKTVLCLQRGLIPPNLHFTRWNPTITAEGTRLFVPTELNPGPPRPDHAWQPSPRSASPGPTRTSSSNRHQPAPAPPPSPAPASCRTRSPSMPCHPSHPRPPPRTGRSSASHRRKCFSSPQAPRTPCPQPRHVWPTGWRTRTPAHSCTTSPTPSPCAAPRAVAGSAWWRLPPRADPCPAFLRGGPRPPGRRAWPRGRGRQPPPRVGVLRPRIAVAGHGT